MSVIYSIYLNKFNCSSLTFDQSQKVFYLINKINEISFIIIIIIHFMTMKIIVLNDIFGKYSQSRIFSTIVYDLSCNFICIYHDAILIQCLNCLYLIILKNYFNYSCYCMKIQIIYSLLTLFQGFLLIIYLIHFFLVILIHFFQNSVVIIHLNYIINFFLIYALIKNFLFNSSLKYFFFQYFLNSEYYY